MVGILIILTTIILITAMTETHKLLKLLQLSSPTLPIGAFAYSQGLESAVESALITNSQQLKTWLHDALRLNLQQVDIPIFKRMYQSWSTNNIEAVHHWNQQLRAQRETHELREEDHHLGLALARLLAALKIEQAAALTKRHDLCFITLFALAATRWNINQEQAANGLLWSWLDNQIAAAIKLVPLGQTEGQIVLSDLLEVLPNVVSEGLTLKDEEIGGSLPMLAILSAQHETQYSRLFRS